jgi:hypothetical protein
LGDLNNALAKNHDKQLKSLENKMKTLFNTSVLLAVLLEYHPKQKSVLTLVNPTTFEKEAL